MRQKYLYLEHYHGEKFNSAKKVSPKQRHYVIGSSRVSDLRLLGKDVAGVQAVVEHRAPYWYLVACGNDSDVIYNDQAVHEMKIEGGESVYIGDHSVKFHLSDPQRKLFSTDTQNTNELNAHQVLVVREGDIVETLYLNPGEAYKFHFDGEEHVMPAPSSKEWKFKQFGKYLVQQRLTHRPSDEDRQKPSLKLITGDLKTAGVSLFAFFAVFVSIGLLQPSKTDKKSNRYVQMVYDAKMMQELREEAEQVNQQRFVASEKKQKKTEDVTPEKEYVAKVVKNIRAKGLSKLVGRIAARAAKDAINIKALNQLSQQTAQQRQQALSSADLFGKKLKVSDKKFKARKLASIGSLKAQSGAKGAKLSKGKVASGEVGIVEEEIMLDGGLDREVIAAYIRSKLGEIRYCYERQLASNSDLHGKIMVKFTIGSSGKVNAKRVANTTLKNAIVEGCILRRIAAWKFPNPKGGVEVDVSYPFLFKSVN